MRKDQLLSRLVRDYNFPTEGIKPWASKAGKEAICRLLEAHGISRHELPRTATGAPSLGAEGILEVTAGTQVEDFGTALAELLGQRSLPQLALDCTHKDGKVHPSILPLQRSGRWSITEPGLTIWGSKEGKDDDKAYFLPDNDDHVLIEADYSAADARIVAALSGDKEYAKRFETDENGNDLYDAHNITGEAAFGAETYYERILKNGKPLLRDLAKVISHLTNYRGGPPKLAASLNKACSKMGLDIRYTVAEAKVFIDNINKTFKGVTAWKNRAVAEGAQGWITNDWGREMVVSEGSEYTQAPALLGQGGTRDVLADGLIRMAKRGLLRYVKIHVHDAVVFSVPKTEQDTLVPQLVECMETVYRGMPFPVSTGHGAINWKEAAHG
jgi:DNA polymerase-1